MAVFAVGQILAIDIAPAPTRRSRDLTRAGTVGPAVRARLGRRAIADLHTDEVEAGLARARRTADIPFVCQVWQRTDSLVPEIFVRSAEGRQECAGADRAQRTVAYFPAMAWLGFGGANKIDAVETFQTVAAGSVRTATSTGNAARFEAGAWLGGAKGAPFTCTDLLPRASARRVAIVVRPAHPLG